MLDALDAAAVRAWSHRSVELLTEHRSEIDALNVFPVPDSDTGSNLLTTFRAAHEAATGDTAADVFAGMAAAAARGAVGNSGFIASQVLRGFADAAREAQRRAAPADAVAGVAVAATVDAAVLAAGLNAGAELGRTAVVGPLEGTILTVASAAAAAARNCLEKGGTLADVAREALTAAGEALARTPDQLPDLADAGVVDAGGRGLVVALSALVEVVTGQAAELAPAHVPTALGIRHTQDEDGYGFEVQYLLDADPEAVDRLRDVLADVGGSVAVVPAGDGVWNVHVHVDDVGAAIEAGLEIGRPHRISVVAFDGHAPSAGEAPRAGQPAPADRADPADRAHAAHPDAGVAVVAIAPSGLVHLFEREGVHVVEADEAEPPSVDAVLAAIDAAGARELVLLPNAARAARVADAAAARARADGLRVTVVPTRSPVQGLSAVAVHDPGRRFDDDVVAMAEAAAATRYAEVSLAPSEALTSAGICRPGDVLGSIDGEVVEIGRGLLAVAFGLVDRLVGVGAELMTVVVGEQTPRRTGELVAAHVRGRSPLTDVTVYEGGPADRPVMIGVE